MPENSTNNTNDRVKRQVKQNKDTLDKNTLDMNIDYEEFLKNNMNPINYTIRKLLKSPNYQGILYRYMNNPALLVK